MYIPLIALLLNGCGNDLLDQTVESVEVIKTVDTTNKIIERIPMALITDPIIEHSVDIIFILGEEIADPSCSVRQVLHNRVVEANRLSASLDNPYFVAIGNRESGRFENCDGNIELTDALAIQSVLIQKYGVSAEHIILLEESTNNEEHAKVAKHLTDTLLKKNVNISSMNLVSSQYDIEYDDQNGSYYSSVAAFNAEYGDHTFSVDNTFASGAIAPHRVWSSDFTFENGWNSLNEDDGIFIEDVNNNGRSDLVVIKGSEVYVGLSTGEKFIKNAIWSSTLPNSLHASVGRKVMMGDFTGNGATDILTLTDHGAYVSESNGSEFSEPTQWNEMSLGNSWNLGEDLFQVVDYNGNGRDDLVVFHLFGTYLFPSSGEFFDDSIKVSDDFGGNARVPDANISYLLDSNTQQYAERVLGDINGDGLADVVVFGYQSIFVAEQRKVGGFSPLKVWLENEERSDVSKQASGSVTIRSLVDMTGNGMADITVSDDNGVLIALSNGQAIEHGAASYYSFDIDEGEKENLQAIIFSDVTGNGLNDLISVSEQTIFVAENITP